MLQLTPYVLPQQLQLPLIYPQPLLLMHYVVLSYCKVSLRNGHHSTELEPAIKAVRVVELSDHYKDAVACIGEEHVVRDAHFYHLVCYKPKNKGKGVGDFGGLEVLPDGADEEALGDG